LDLELVLAELGNEEVGFNRLVDVCI